MRTFPIFVSVDRKPPLVTGGGELAAIKARLLLKRAETVNVAAGELGPELAELARAGRVTLIAAQPGVDQIRGRPLVIAATGDDDEDARVAAAARALGVPVNVPDKPALCSFVMPAIVDRGEVTVAIGTEGTSPVLAQRLRAWLERELERGQALVSVDTVRIVDLDREVRAFDGFVKVGAFDCVQHPFERRAVRRRQIAIRAGNHEEQRASSEARH